MDQANVLIISDDPTFSRAVTSRWRGEAIVPAFTLLAESDRAVDGVFDVAVLGDIPTMSLASLLRSLAAKTRSRWFWR